MYDAAHSNSTRSSNCLQCSVVEYLGDTFFRSKKLFYNNCSLLKVICTFLGCSTFCGVHGEEIVPFTNLNCLSFKALSQGQCALKRFTGGRLAVLHNEFEFKFDRHVQTKTEAAVYLWLWFRAICNDKNFGCYPNRLSAHSNGHIFIFHINEVKIGCKIKSALDFL